MVSNFLGFKSESGILMANACSSALTMSGRTKESSIPESKRDSSGCGFMFFLETVRMISAICARLSIVDLADQILPDFLVLVVIVHQVAKQRISQAVVARRGEVY